MLSVLFLDYYVLKINININHLLTTYLCIYISYQVLVIIQKHPK